MLSATASAALPCESCWLGASKPKQPIRSSQQGRALKEDRACARGQCERPDKDWALVVTPGLALQQLARFACMPYQRRRIFNHLLKNQQVSETILTSQLFVELWETYTWCANWEKEEKMSSTWFVSETVVCQGSWKQYHRVNRISPTNFLMRIWWTLCRKTRMSLMPWRSFVKPARTQPGTSRAFGWIGILLYESYCFRNTRPSVLLIHRVPSSTRKFGCGVLGRSRLFGKSQKTECRIFTMFGRDQQIDVGIPRCKDQRS